MLHTSKGGNCSLINSMMWQQVMIRTKKKTCIPSNLYPQTYHLRKLYATDFLSL